MCGVRPKNCVFFCVAFQLWLAKRCFWAQYRTTWSGLRLASCFSAVWPVGVFPMVVVGGIDVFSSGNACALDCLAKLNGLHGSPKRASCGVKKKKGTTEVIPFRASRWA